MTEAEWLSGTDPEAMLLYIAGKASERKLLLFGCACWRRLWHLLPRGPAREVIELAERYADGLAGKDELEHARGEAFDVTVGGLRRLPREARKIEVMGGLDSWCASDAPAFIPVVVGQRAAEWAGPWAVAAESKAQCDLLREVFGNPFRPAGVEPAWRRWNGGTVVKVAQAIYEERRFADLPILADALEEAGCDRADMVEHCRAGGEHVRGCWLVDRLLEKG